MLQQTQMEVVLKYYAAFLDRFPTLAALASSTEQEVMAAWSGLGYYRRARMLRAGAIDVMHRFGGRVPHDLSDLLSLPGVGRYTAGAIRSIAFNERAPIVDGNVARVFARVFGDEDDAWARAAALVDECTSPRSLNQGLMEIGALICTPRNPSCLLCPVRDDCATRSDALPIAKPKKETHAMRIALYLITDRRGRVLMRREEGPLMSAMWHLPHGDTSLLTGTPLTVHRLSLLGKVRHTVTTRRIEFEVYEATLTSTTKDHKWIDPAKLDDVPHPSYVRKALALIGSR